MHIAYVFFIVVDCVTFLWFAFTSLFFLSLVCNMVIGPARIGGVISLWFYT